MTPEERLLTTFRAVFGQDLAELPDSASPDTIEGWDSAKHLQLMLALEEEFGVEFEADEIANLTTAGAIRQRLNSHSTDG